MSRKLDVRMAHERQIRCIAFDAVGTLIHPVPPAGDVYHQVAFRYGSHLAPEEVSRRFRQSFHETEQGDLALPERQRLLTSEAREYERWKTIVTGVLDDVNDVAACFEELFAHFAHPTSWRCFDEVPEVLSRLHERGYRLAIASNFDRRLHSVCNGLPPLARIDVRVISSEVGCRKPGPAFFDALVTRAGCRAEEILMVGDDLTNDIEGARHAGLQAVFLNRREPPAPGELSNLRELIEML